MSLSSDRLGYGISCWGYHVGNANSGQDLWVHSTAHTIRTQATSCLRDHNDLEIPEQSSTCIHPCTRWSSPMGNLSKTGPR